MATTKTKTTQKAKASTSKTGKKKIIHYNFFKINAISHSGPCGGGWEFDAVADVYFDDGTSQVFYFDTADLDIPCGWQILSKNADEIINAGEDIKKYIIAEYKTNRSAFASPYGDVIRTLNDIFKKITSL